MARHILAFDTSTERLSIALGRDLATPAERVWHHEGAGGAQASAQLLPAILALMAQAGLTFTELEAIAFGAGPGAFTGLRTACAVAQGLGFAANRPLLPVDSLLALAEDARVRLNPGAGAPDHLQIVAMLDARMDEIYVGRYAHAQGQWQTLAPVQLLRPEALTADAGWTLAGNAFIAYGARWPAALQNLPRTEALPTAAAMLRLAPALLAQGLAVPAEEALPVYVRDKVAQTTQERMDLRAAAEIATQVAAQTASTATPAAGTP